MSTDDNHVYHGSEWPEYEDILIGNRKGLETLRSAIDEALENVESSSHMGEFLGVRCVETEFFERQENSSSVGSKISFVILGVAFAVTAVVVFLSLSA